MGSETLGGFALGRVHLGDCLDLLREIPAGTVDALITDPPYSSGGFTRGDRTADPAEKYTHSGTEIIRGSFSGDNRDGRSWCYWSALWLSEAHRALRGGGYAMVFCDWRQLPLATDAMQAGGFVWRGVVAWDKGEGARAPHTGYFRHQCEYVVWGTKGPLSPATHGGPWPGCARFPVIQADKHHLTGKPTALMRALVKVVPEQSIVLDPFAGSGSTAVGCLVERRRFLGFELDPECCRLANKRIEAEGRALNLADANAGQAPLFGGAS
jgi:site-specific DNA-methyltransferase (adenine-specific)